MLFLYYVTTSCALNERATFYRISYYLLLDILITDIFLDTERNETICEKRKSNHKWGYCNRQTH